MAFKHDGDNLNIVVEPDGAVDGEHDHKQPEACADTGGHDIKLSDEAGRERDTGQREKHGRECSGCPGTPPQEAVIIVHEFGVMVFVRQHCDDAEGAYGGDEIGDQIEHHGFDADTTAREECYDDVTHVRDGRVRQYTLYVALAQGKQITNEH